MGTLQWSYRSFKRIGVASCVVFGLVALAASPAFSQSIRWFPELNPSDSGSGSLAWDISADGQVVVGTISTSRGLRPFRWTREGGYEILTQIEGGAYSVSADGSVVVGFVASNPQRAFRWTRETGAVILPALNPIQSASARAVSADGNTIAGSSGVSVEGGSPLRAVVWIAGGVLPLDLDFASDAWGISADGSAVAGYALGLSGVLTAFRWTASDGMVGLGTLGGSFSFAFDISADGTTVVGFSSNSNNQSRAFRRRVDQRRMQDLGTLGGNSSIAYGVNNDGSVVYGTSSTSASRTRAFIWTETEGMRDLNEVFPEVVSDGSVLISVRAVSLDGRYLVGWGDRPNGRREAFVLDTWRFGAARAGNCIDDDDLLAVLFAFGTSGTGYTRHEDINKDGIVDEEDLLIVLSNFGQGCQ